MPTTLGEVGGLIMKMKYLSKTCLKGLSNDQLLDIISSQDYKFETVWNANKILRERGYYG